jgi:arylsulfatase A-like enzyme
MLNNLDFIVMDSCRFDSLEAAATPTMDRFGAAQRRYSFASWTSPSHQTFLMGQLPHVSPRGVFASEVYKKEYARWTERVGIADLSFKTFVPELCLAKVLKKLGYRTVARVSMPVLNAFAGFDRGFDDYRLMTNHNDFAGMVDEIDFSGPEPCFYFLNLGETHYPYMLQDDDLPRISGVHGVLSMDDLVARSSDDLTADQTFFSMDAMRHFRAQQSRCVEYVDGVLGQLVEKSPANTYFIVTSDHGELFGEDGYFGHGPVMHEKCFEVPFLEGIRPS